MIAIAAAVINMNRINQQENIKISLDSSTKKEDEKPRERHWSNTDVSEERHWDK